MKGHVAIFLLFVFMAFLACSVFAGDNIRIKDEKILQSKIKTGSISRDVGLGLIPGRMGMISSILRMEDKLKLSDEQKAKIHELMILHRKDMINKNAEREIAEVELFELMQKDNPDMNAIREKMQKIANIRADQQFSAFKLSMDVKNVLTEEQWKEFKEQMKDRRPMMKDMDKRTESRRFGQPERKMRQR